MVHDERKESGRSIEIDRAEKRRRAEIAMTTQMQAVA